MGPGARRPCPRMQCLDIAEPTVHLRGWRFPWGFYCACGRFAGLARQSDCRVVWLVAGCVLLPVPNHTGAASVPVLSASLLLLALPALAAVARQVYAPRHRDQWLSRVTHSGVHRRAELLYQQMDALSVVRHTVRGELLTESRKHEAVKILRQIPSIGPLRAALLLALMQTPYRFRTKRQLWTYSGLAVVTQDSAQHRYVDGQLQRSKKPQQIRGLNQNHNHEMKSIFKGTALSASQSAGPLQDFYAGLLTKGMKPEMARLTLARKIAAIALTLWKKGGRFDAEHLKSQAA